MNQHLNELKSQVERVLHWEPATHWRDRDFVTLSERIFAHTRQSVRPRDLQDVWQSARQPSLVVLNTLARFVDYSSWDEFLERNTYGTVDDEETRTTRLPVREIPSGWVLVICGLSVLASILVGILLVWKR